MSTLAPPVNSRWVVMSHPAALFAPLGVGYDGLLVDLDNPQAGWRLAGAPLRAEVRHTYQPRIYGGRAGEPDGVRRIANGRESTAVVVGYHEQNFDLFGLIYSMLRYGGGAVVDPKIYAHEIGDTAEFAALLVEDNDNEIGGMDQTVWYFPHLLATTGLSSDMSQVPLVFDIEAEALMDVIGMPDGAQIYATHMIFSFRP